MEGQGQVRKKSPGPGLDQTSDSLCQTDKNFCEQAILDVNKASNAISVPFVHTLVVSVASLLTRSPCYDFKRLKQSSTVVGSNVQVLMSLEECKS